VGARKRFRVNGCPWDKWTCAYAAEGGHLEVLEWARANGCPWDKWTCRLAAEGGQLETLKWARENGCPWNEHTRRLSASMGCVETVTCGFDWIRRILSRRRETVRAFRRRDSRR
jgi:hypothetical protein